LNALTSTSTQVALADGDAVAVFEDMYSKASSQLRSDSSAQFLCTREVFDNYRKYLQAKGENSTIEFTREGFQSLRWNGYEVVNMETVWDTYNRTYFEQDSTNNAYYLPNRVLFTTPENIPVAFLNEGDIMKLDAWFSKDDQDMKILYGYTLDAKLLEEYMAVVAY